MKFFYIISTIFLLLFTYANASVYKGQKEYMKNCKKCHGNGAKIAKSKSTDEWVALFSNNAAPLKQLHKKDEKTMKYFNSERFKKKERHLLHFFKKYASDSGNVPACSD